MYDAQCKHPNYLLLVLFSLYRFNTSSPHSAVAEMCSCSVFEMVCFHTGALVRFGPHGRPEKKRLNVQKK